MFTTGQTDEQRQRARQTRHDRQSQKAAQAAPTVEALLADVGGELPAYAQAHAEKAKKGNVRALVALKCLDCCCWQKNEVAACPVTTCPLYPLRPYKRAEK
jgi:hypothetical protein